MCVFVCSSSTLSREVQECSRIKLISDWVLPNGWDRKTMEQGGRRCSILTREIEEMDGILT